MIHIRHVSGRDGGITDSIYDVCSQICIRKATEKGGEKWIVS